VRARRLGRAALLAAPLLATLGCGYSVGFDGPAARRAVGILVVENRTFRQRLEIPLTRALERALPLYSRFHPTAPEAADLLLRVEIVDVDNRLVVGAGGGLPMREGALEFEVRAALVDAQDGMLLRDARLVDRAEFRLPVGEDEVSATEEAVSDLARRIVLSLEGDP